jgi:hypothetical protein
VIGLVIDKLILKDGTTYAGFTIKEFLKILAKNADSHATTCLFSRIQLLEH